jgi:hypothetical protein
VTLLDAGAAAASQAGKYVLPEGLRLLHYHKQRTSARLRFLMFASGLVAPGPLDPTAVLLPGPPWSALGRVIAHPAAVASACAGHFGLSREALCVDAEFRLHGEELGRPFTLLLAEFLTVDPPFDPAARVGGRFVAITEARGLGNAEREALRLAYSHILG